MELKTRYVYEKETKNCVCFRPLSDVAVGNLYLKKDKFPAKSGDEIEVSITKL